LKQPPTWLKPPAADEFSYVKYFDGYTVNEIPIEPSYWSAITGNAFPAATIWDVYDGWGYLGFFSPKVWGDMMLGYDD